MKETKKILKYWTIGIIIGFVVLEVICSFIIDRNNSFIVSQLTFGLLYTLLFVWGAIAIPLIIEILTEKSVKNDIVDEKIDYSDLEKIKEYYREILNVNSPIVIGFIDEFEISKNALIAELLYLKAENIIDINDKKIKVIYSGDRKELSEIQRYILYCLEDGKLKITDSFKRLKNLILNEFQNLVKPVKIKRFSNLKRTFMYLLGGALICLLMNSSKLPNGIDILALLLGCFGFFILAYMAKYDKLSTDGIFKRTDKGEELNKKIEGLKNYLKDYSLLSERESKEIELWDEYLIYSVLFGQNVKIIEEYSNYIEINEENQ